MIPKTINRIFKTELLKNPATLTEFDYNELKLNTVITEIEKEILVIRTAKIKHGLEKQSQQAANNEAVEIKKQSWFSKLKQKFDYWSKI